MEQTDTRPKQFCFVLMPFSVDFDDIYQLGIKESCADAGAYCERVDEQIFKETILERIFNQISKADFIVADMTGRNPNVFYEVGYAHALGKPCILLTQDTDDIPFDLKHYPHIVYEKKITVLKEELTRRIKWFVENPSQLHKSGLIDIDLFLDNQNLSQGNVVYNAPKDYYPEPEVTIHNASGHTFRPGELKIGILTPSNYSTIFRSTGASKTKLPDGRYLHMLPEFKTLFPGSYESFKYTLADTPTKGGDPIIFRVFTDVGTRDYPLLITIEE